MIASVMDYQEDHTSRLNYRELINNLKMKRYEYYYR